MTVRKGEGFIIAYLNQQGVRIGTRGNFGESPERPAMSAERVIRKVQELYGQLPPITGPRGIIEIAPVAGWPALEASSFDTRVYIE